MRCGCLEPERQVFMAIAVKVYQQMAKTKAILNSLERFHFRMIIFDPDKKEIVSWIKY